ncbi:zinc-binding dehydrogenase [Microdochium trichocladiopsis]|uniref:Zinc-binding dehydrogenase n=1 Tax=Microdochium trichocladiopsis TaxID=1682393 RepID=A0A9P9BQU8_9PEZI|nr:zinc-binding dehydrogenase [Microdochium trichocladiopsis]KAH7035263.1 zinc-binding dehydrogenase [Microdochium trichocladiopsis]
MSRRLTIKKIEGKPGAVFYPLQLNDVPKPEPGPNEVLVKIHAAALNHRDFFQRQHLYPGISFENPILADGSGTVVAVGADVSASTKALLNKPVILTPSRGWAAHPDGPEDYYKFSVIGGSVAYPFGCGQDYMAVHESEVEPQPEHLSAHEAAALPLVGLTGWRAFVTKSGNAVPGRNILVTGIGGGVALQVLQFAVAKGCSVYVTSGDPAKLEKAKKLGAAGGVSYRDKDWDKQLLKQLPKSRPYIDAIIDGAGGDVVNRAVRLLKPGGVVSCYGMTTGPKMPWTMSAVLKNVELKGSTMGSRAEFAEMVAFVAERKIVPVVSRVVKGLDNLGEIDGLFKEMGEGKQFGKLVIEISKPGETAKL